MDSTNALTSIAVIGAGIVGLSVALELQRQGHQITVIDQEEPMSGCSAGNAGYLSEANIFPPGSPDMLMQLPGMLLSTDGPLVIKPAYAPRMVGWGRRALTAVKEESRLSIIDSLAGMTVRAYDAIQDLAAHAGAQGLLSRDGGLVAYKTPQALDKKCGSLPIWRDHGIVVHRLSGDDVRQLEPALVQDIVGGLMFQNSGRCSNPRKLGQLYAQHLQFHGAQFVRGSIQGLASGSTGEAVLRCTNGEMRFSKVVVCAGYWSGTLLEPYFPKIPIVSERGYHLMLPDAAVSLRRPVVFGEPHFAATPMDEGLRLAGTAEFASAERPPNHKRATMLLRLAQQYLGKLNDEGAQPWMGVRPSLPDGLPAVGQVPSHPAIHYAFGHAHNGLTLSALTATCVAAQIGGRRAPVDLTALDLKRFGRDGQQRRAPTTSTSQSG